MRVHLKAKHAKTSETFQCISCPKIFMYKSSLVKHHKDKHTQTINIGNHFGIFEVTPENNNKTTFSCDQCKETFQSNTTLVKHIQKHSVKVYKCKSCEKVFNNRSGLYFHTLAKHNDSFKMIPCTLCESKFTRQASLKSHMKKFHKKEKHRACKEKNNMQFSEDEVIDMIKDANLTDRQVLVILSHVRKKFGKNVVTSKIKEKLRDRKRILDEFMTSEDIVFLDKHGVPFTTNLVYCKDIVGLVEFICDWRNVEKSECEMAVGVDNGKGKLIMTFNCVVKNELGDCDFSSAGAKKGFVIGCAEMVPENYNNVAIFFEKTKVELINPKYVNDCKMNNILIGIQSNSCKFPCFFAECSKDKDGKWTEGPKRTMENLKMNLEHWKKETNSDRKKLKLYKNVEFMPIIKFDKDSDLVINNIVPPGLHVLDLGPPNKIFNKLDEVVPGVATVWKNLGCIRDQFNDHGFDGNTVRRILGHLDLFDAVVPEPFKILLEILRFG